MKCNRVVKPIKFHEGRSFFMPDVDAANEARNFHIDIPARTTGNFFLKGSGSLDWGMQNGLARVDVNILPLLPYAGALMCTRGILRSPVPSASTTPVVLRASGGPSILKELSHEEIAIDIDDALRLNVSALAVQVFIGGEFETRTVHNMTRLVDLGLRYGIPVMGVTAVGKDMVRDARYLRLACRICAELGAQFVKTYYVGEGFETVTASCPVPIVMAGGKKLPELDALTMAYRAIQEGAAGVDMGRNIFQSASPIGMIQAVNKVVHEGMKPAESFDLYNAICSNQAEPLPVSSS